MDGIGKLALTHFTIRGGSKLHLPPLRKVSEIPCGSQSYLPPVTLTLFYCEKEKSRKFTGSKREVRRKT